jgi:acetyl-CoA carboxylase biotin carboxyl carrier protein
MAHEVKAEMAGSVWKVEVTAGQVVAEGDILFVLESMKMEIPVETPVGGRVSGVLVGAGDVVAEDQVLAVVDGA